MEVVAVPTHNSLIKIYVKTVTQDVKSVLLLHNVANVLIIQ